MICQGAKHPYHIVHTTNASTVLGGCRQSGEGMSPTLEAALVLLSPIAVVALAVILIATSDGEGCTPGPYCDDCPFPRCEDSKK